MLPEDPYNLIITGVGGQGNVLASKVMGGMLIAAGLQVTIGETFGASQRGGSVMSHLRVSAHSTWSPQIPGRRAHAILALEPMEALRVLGIYGNPRTLVITNSRPVYPTDVIAGERTYREVGQIARSLERFGGRAWIVDATDKAMSLGAAIYANIVLIGAFSAAEVLPLDRRLFRSVISSMLGENRVDANLKAFDAGRDALFPGSPTGDSGPL
jgi:indolepyruvate ferredoxin oxidoreductase beta subunit